MAHPFTVGRTYRNRQGEYEVLAIHGDQMTTRYQDGVEKSVSVTLQARICENIQADEAPPQPQGRDDKLTVLLRFFTRRPEQRRRLLLKRAGAV